LDLFWYTLVTLQAISRITDTINALMSHIVPIAARWITTALAVLKLHGRLIFFTNEAAVETSAHLTAASWHELETSESRLRHNLNGAWATLFSERGRLGRRDAALGVLLKALTVALDRNAPGSSHCGIRAITNRSEKDRPMRFTSTPTVVVPALSDTAPL